MLTRILKAFAAPEPEPLPEPDEKLALGALMVRVAKSDNHYLVAEISQIDKVLAVINECGPVEAAKMRAICEKLEKQAPEIKKFGKIIRETVRHEMRVRALSALWSVVLADGVRRDEEVMEVESARIAMGLSEKDNLTALEHAQSPSI